MKLRTSQSIVYLLLGIAVLVVCFNAWLAVHSVDDLLKSERSVTQTWHVINSLERVSNSLKDAETGARGYLLSGDPKDLIPYNQAKAALPEELATVTALVTDSTAQQGALRELRAVIDSRISLLEQSIQERRAGKTDSIHMQVLGGTGLAEMNHGRTLVAGMEQTERRLLAERTAASNRDAGRTRATLIFASVVDLLLIVLMFRQIAIERWLRQHADRTLTRLEKLQRVSDVALTQLTADELTEALISRVREVISADAVLLCMRRDGSTIVEAATGVAIDPGAAIPSDPDSPLDRALVQNRMVMVTDTAMAPLPLGSLRRHTRSLLIAPLSVSRSAAGALLAGRQTVHAFDSQDEEMLSVVADRIAMTLDRASAYEAQRQARKEAETKAEEVRSLNAELEERVWQRTADLEATNRELEAFSYSVSHDLRAPLRTIDGFSLALEEEYGGAIDSIGQDYLRRIREGVQRMGHLIDSLLQLSRITRADLIREPVNLSALAGSVAGELTAHYPDRSIVFNIQPGLACTGDVRLLRAALENLLGNAAKFTAREPESRIEFGRSGDAYFIRDNGVGFDQRYKDKLFNAFNRLHGDRDFRGSGIGLATVARIVRRHQGTVWAEGKVGQGATFWFTLG